MIEVEFVELYIGYGECGSRLLLDICELGFVGADEQRHDGQSQLRVKQWV